MSNVSLSLSLSLMRLRLRFMHVMIKYNHVVRNDMNIKERSKNLHGYEESISSQNFVRYILSFPGFYTILIFYMPGKGQKRRQYKTGKSLPPSGYLLRYLVSSSCIRKNREEFNSKIETYTWENHKNTEKIRLFSHSYGIH